MNLPMYIHELETSVKEKDKYITDLTIERLATVLDEAYKSFHQLSEGYDPEMIGSKLIRATSDYADAFLTDLATTVSCCPSIMAVICTDDRLTDFFIKRLIKELGSTAAVLKLVLDASSEIDS